MVKKQGFVVWILLTSLYTKKTGYIHKDTAEDVETRLDTQNYELDKPLPKEKIKKKLD